MKKDMTPIYGVAALAAIYFYIRYKKKQEAKSSFSNASGCSSSDLSEAMDTCEGGAMQGETTSIKKCSVRNNGTRRVTCKYEGSNGGVRFRDIEVGGISQKLSKRQ
tara:strand:+ start:10830 stop:11147 length:318 start_codon:yes stop_codon:yes gene_type:complete